VRVVLTARGAGLLAAGLVSLGLAFYALNLILFVFATFFIVLVAAELLSFAYVTRGFEAAAFRAQRIECSSFVPVRGAAFVAVRVEPQLPSGIYFEVFDSHPDHLRVVDGADRLLTWGSPGRPQTIAYVASPTVRGRFELGPTVVVAHDTFGFGFKAARLSTPWTVEAIPRYPSVALRRPGRLPAAAFGPSAQSARGEGLEFHSLREYSTTDDARRIAWTRSGMGTFYVREFQRENQEDLLVVLDSGRTMAAGPVESDALEKAVEAAGLTAEYAFEEGFRFGLLVFSDRVVQYLPPGRGPDHEFQIARALAAAQTEPRDSSMGDALGFLTSRLKLPTRLLAFSALDGDVDELARVWGTLTRRGHRLNLFVPVVRAMYPDLPLSSGRQAFELILAPDADRVEQRVEALRQLGVSTMRYGQRGALDLVDSRLSRPPGRRIAG
jgi:uncharacterized protein (DUF58 family)